MNNFELFDAERTYVVLPHIFPDGDTLGSSVALYEFLKEYAKDVYLVLNDKIPNELKFFMEDTVMSLDEFLNLKLVDYDVITVDSSDLTRIKDRFEIYKNAIKTLNIDHHVTNENFSDINLVDFEASSTGEIIYEILEYYKFDFLNNKRVLNSLYAAISTDTGSFKYSNTTAKTHIIISKLIDYGLDVNYVNVELYQNIPLTRIGTLNLILESLILKFDNKLAMSFITLNKMKEKNLKEINSEGMVEFLRNIDGVEIAVFIKELEKDYFKISLRSKHDIDVSKIALKFGGGGHVKAAGCSIKGTINQIKFKLMEEIKKEMERDE